MHLSVKIVQWEAVALGVISTWTLMILADRLYDYFGVTQCQLSD
jgi:hypothetical protein